MTGQPTIPTREEALAELDQHLAAVTVAEDHLRLKQHARDGGIIMARRAGISANDLAARTGLNVSRIYQIIAAWGEEPDTA